MSFISFNKLVSATRISEYIRHIRSNLDFFGNEGHKLITISSTISGEGKTFVTLNLAGILALSDKKVIVLDFDMRKPMIVDPHGLIFHENGVGKRNVPECPSVTLSFIKENEVFCVLMSFGYT